MPELPDIELYIHALRSRIVGQRLERVRLASPFLVRSVEPPLDQVFGRIVRGLRRIGKRIVWELDDGLFLVIHLMIAGRFRWYPTTPEAATSKSRGRTAGPIKAPGKVGLAAFEFSNGTLILTEAGSERRASMHVVHGESQLAELDPGGIEVLTSCVDEFGEALTRENHTLKRALTDPHVFSGVGNAYSDEILHAAKLSPMQLTSRLTKGEVARLHTATVSTLIAWRDRLIAETGEGFPEKVTAFREGMSTHGRFGQPCPVCATPIQRIRYASNEANYCPTCQTGGKLLADRAMSRLLKQDWPRSLGEMDRHMTKRRQT
ncbi:MAG: Fpg/Nei family DNA glycosylase [Vicinamibacterales bacterium]